MSWIKRNLIFVISAAVGLILTGVGGWLLWTAMSENAEARGQLDQALTELKGFQTKNPFPSDENIQLAREQQLQVSNLLTELQSTFAPFPAVEEMNNRAFKTYLDKTIAQLQLDATNAGVALPVEDYAFSFSAIKPKLHFPADSIRPWLGQLQEIKVICRVLFNAKINALILLRRVPAGSDEVGPDYLNAPVVSNDQFVATPYIVQFLCYSPEVGAVLDGFAKSSNCIVVKNVDIQMASTESSASSLNALQQQQSPVRGRTPPPVTVITEHALRVTMALQVIKPKPTEH